MANSMYMRDFLIQQRSSFNGFTVQYLKKCTIFHIKNWHVMNLRHKKYLHTCDQLWDLVNFGSIPYNFNFLKLIPHLEIVDIKFESLSKPHLNRLQFGYFYLKVLEVIFLAEIWQHVIDHSAGSVWTAQMSFR